MQITLIVDVTVRKRNQPVKGDPPDPLTRMIADAVELAAEAAEGVGSDIRGLINGRQCLGAVFAAAREAVADAKPGSIDTDVFDAAMSAAAGAVPGSAIQIGYDRVRSSVEPIPKYMIRAACRRAASDLVAEMSVQGRAADDRSLPDKIRTAADQAAKARLERADGEAAVQAATVDAKEIADISVELTSDMVMVGAPVHAAVVAVLEVAIRGVPPADLANAIKNACADMPKTATQHHMIGALVTALALMIAADATRWRKYQTAVQGAEDVSRNEAADRIVDEITGNTFEAVYMALVVVDYANFDRSAFESGYKKALAAAFGMDPGYGQQAGSIALGGPPPSVDGVEMPAEFYMELQQRLATAIELEFGYEVDPARRKMYMNASEVDYKMAASNIQTAGLISLYKMAYRAGYEGARRCLR